MNESEFISLVDCAFPYGRPTRWRQLSATAPRISSNAAFMVLHEVCRVPRSVPMDQARSEAMISHLRRRFRHPALRVIEPAIRSYLAGTKLRPSTAAALMRKVAVHTGEYNALALCHFIAYDDRNGVLERTYQHITSRWNGRADHAAHSV